MKQDWKDLRQHQATDVLTRAISKLGANLAVFGESCQAVAGVEFVDRTTVCDKLHLIFAQFPPNTEVFEGVLTRCGAQHIYLLGSATSCDYKEPAAFVKRLFGMVRFAINKKEGQVESEKLAAALSASKMSIALGLTILRKINLVDWFSEDGIVHLDLLGEPYGAAEDLPEYRQLAASLDAAREFRSWCSTVALKDIQLAIVPNHIKLVQESEAVRNSLLPITQGAMQVINAQTDKAPRTEEHLSLPLDEDKENWLKNIIRDIPDFPKPGIIFKDLTPVLADAEAFSFVINVMAQRCRTLKPDVIAGIEARGFIIAPTIAYLLGTGFVPIRKPGKLPYKVNKMEYALEYGTDSIEVHADSVKKGDRVVLIDDLLATGGTALAAYKLLTGLQADVVGIGFIVELQFLNGRAKLPPATDSFALVNYR